MLVGRMLSGVHWFLSKFKSLATPYIEYLPTPPLPNGVESYWSWLFQMQHYGVPTRLLDWSRDALVALYYATNPEDRSLLPRPRRSTASPSGPSVRYIRSQLRMRSCPFTS